MSQLLNEARLSKQVEPTHPMRAASLTPALRQEEPKQMLDKLPLVNLTEFELEVADMVANRISP